MMDIEAISWQATIKAVSNDRHMGYLLQAPIKLVMKKRVS